MLFVGIVRPLLTVFLRARFRPRVVDPQGIGRLEPPFFVVANHVTFWDPFLIGINLKGATQFIASDNIFRGGFFSVAMRLLGSIPTTKFMKSMETVAMVFGVVKAGRSVGVFPEGQRSWDGRSIGVREEIPKLAAKLKVPVIGVQIRGGFLSRPRWSKSMRSGRVELAYEYLLAPDEIGSVKKGDVADRMSRFLTYDESVWQREVQIAFEGRDRAEYLEQLLYACPGCRELGTLHSTGDELICRECGESALLDPFGMPRFQRGAVHAEIATLPEWNEWQQGVLETRIAEGKFQLSNPEVTVFRGYKDRPLRLMSRGTLVLDPAGFRLETEHGNLITFSLAEMAGINLQNESKLEFYVGSDLFRVEFAGLRTPVMLWHDALLLSQKAAGIPMGTPLGS